VTEHVTVSVDDAHVEVIDEVADRCRAAGMDVKYVLPAVGMITGSVASVAQCAVLGALDGVAAVEPRHAFKLPPPGSAVQ
jgi:hypothetical protein